MDGWQTKAIENAVFLQCLIGSGRTRLGSAEPEGQPVPFIAKRLLFHASPFSLSRSRHQWESLPHQLFSSHTENDPSRKCNLRFMCGSVRTPKMLMCSPHMCCILQVQPTESACFCYHTRVQLLCFYPKKQKVILIYGIRAYNFNLRLCLQVTRK